VEIVWKKLHKIFNNESHALGVWNLCGKTKENNDILIPEKERILAINLMI